MKAYTLLELINLLNDGVFSAVELTTMYLNQIKLFDHHLNSVAELNPDALKIAEELDLERKLKGPRSLLHGIPILIKDNINTHDLMHTTANSIALSDLLAPYDAHLVTLLRNSGAIILGKANLSEFAYFMSTDKMPSGYGSRNGQVKNPYSDQIDPLGSSTGSAVAVAANLVPIAIGTETNGSLMAPAYQNSIVAIKPTLGMISRYGIIPISQFQDTAGPMAKTVADCAILLDYMIDYDPHDGITIDAPLHRLGIRDSYKLGVTGKKVGLISFSNYPYSEEELHILDEAKRKLTEKGLIVENFEIEMHPMKNFDTLIYDFKYDFNNYLDTVKGFTAMKSLKDVIDFNKLDPENRLKYGQNILEASESTHGVHDENYIKLRIELVNEAMTLEKLMLENQLDAVLSTYWLSYAPVYGNPSICVPAKALIDLQPRSIVFVGKKWDDATLISIAHTYEQATNHRIPPHLEK